MTQGDSAHTVDPAAFEERPFLLKFLGGHLSRGTLLVVIGAGISKALGLPSWEELVALVANECRYDLTAPLSLEQHCDLIAKRCGGESKLLILAHKALYSNDSSHPSDLLNNPTLRALGSLVASSLRGKVQAVITYNYDTLLEEYLELHGLITQSVGTLPSTFLETDLTVFHPHGVLPRTLNQDSGDAIVLSASSFGQWSEDLWFPQIQTKMGGGCALLLGLSGADSNLMKCLDASNHGHPFGRFWGVRISDDVNDDRKELFQIRGIGQYTISDYDLLPDLLLEVCQEAARLRKA